MRNVLKELGLAELPVITVWNKMDAAATPDILRQVAATCRDTFCISSLSVRPAPAHCREREG